MYTTCPPRRSYVASDALRRGQVCTKAFHTNIQIRPPTNFEVVIGHLRLLILDVFFPHFIRDVPARRYPISPTPQMLTPVALTQRRKFREHPMRTLPFQILHCLRARYMRRDSYQHMHMIPVNRPSVDRHLQTTRDLPQQLPRTLSYITHQHRITVLRNPHQVVFTVPDRMAAALVVFHPPYATSTDLPFA